MEHCYTSTPFGCTLHSIPCCLEAFKMRPTPMWGTLRPGGTPSPAKDVEASVLQMDLNLCSVRRHYGEIEFPLARCARQYFHWELLEGKLT